MLLTKACIQAGSLQLSARSKSIFPRLVIDVNLLTLTLTSTSSTIYVRRCFSLHKSLSNTNEFIQEAQNNDRDKKTAFYSPDDSRLLRVVLVGMPNAGKSTLVNRLMQYEVCPASKRAHTTRKPQRAIFLDNNTQIVFIDTPGVVNQKEVEKFRFSKEFSTGPSKSIKGADVVGVIHDVSHRIRRNKLDKRIIDLLNEYPDKHVFLILNKVDLIKAKRKLLDTLRVLTSGLVGGKEIPFETKKELTGDEILQRAARKLEERLASQTNVIHSENVHHSAEVESVDGPTLEEVSSDDEEYSVSDYRGWPNFQDVFMVSSLKGDGLDSLKDYLVKHAKSSRWDYSEEVLTDYSPPDLSLLVLRSKLLQHVPAEAPYKVTPVLEIWEENDRGDLTIVIGIKCPSARILKMVIGAKGYTITRITHETEESLMKLLRRNISLLVKATCPEGKPNKE